MSFLDSLFSDGDASTPQSPLDQLFSVSPAARQQANSQALMSMAAGLLQASAPSRLPVNLGQALGSAYMQGQGAYDNALTNRMKQQAMAGELAKNKLGVMQSLAGQAAMAKAFGQPAPDYLSQLTGSGGTTVANPVNPSATMGNGAVPTDAGTPTPAGADSASTPGTWSAQQSPAAGFNFAPAAGIADDSASNPVAPTAAPSSQPLLRMPPGMNGATAYALSLNPSTAPIIEKAIENQYPGPSDLAKMLLEQGIKPGSPEWNEKIGKGVDKSVYITPITPRPGTPVLDPRDPSKVLYQTPPVGFRTKPDGSWVIDPGYVAGESKLSGTKAYGEGLGKAFTTPAPTILPNGAPGSTSQGNQMGLPNPYGFPGAGAGSPGGAGSTGSRTPVAGLSQPAKQYPWPASNGTQYNILPGQTGLAPGQSEQAVAQVKNSETLRQANTQAAQSAQQSNYKLDRMEAAMQHFTPGPAASWKGNLATILSKAGLADKDVQQYLGAMTEYNKYGTQLGADMSNQSKAGNAVTVFETMQKANPNVQTPVDAAHNIIASNRALNDYTIARSKMQQAWSDSHQGNLNGFNDWYTNNVNANAFLLPRMSQAERQNYFRSLPKPQLHQLMQDYQNMQTWKRQGLL